MTDSRGEGSVGRAGPILVQPGMAYTCQSSAVCCHVFETIPAGEEVIAGLESEPSLQARGLSGTLPIIREPSETPRLARASCGNCVMLDSDHLCAIHRVLGESAKPQVCRDFPFRYAETPDGVYVGLSFVCPSVRGEKGALLSEQSDFLEKHYAGAASRRSCSAILGFDQRFRIEWEGYLELEKLLVGILDFERPGFRNRIAAMGIAGNLLPRFACELDPGFLSRETPVLDAGLVAKFAASLRADGFESLFHIAGKPVRGGDRARRMFLGMLVSFTDRIQKPRGRMRTLAGILSQYPLNVSGLGSMRLEPVDRRVSRKKLADAGYPVEPESVKLVNRYISHSLFRKDLLQASSIARGIRLLLIRGALIPWYAVAESGKSGAGVPSVNNYSEAIGHVERLYGAHSKFFTSLEANRWFDDVLEGFVLKPNFPLIMAGV